MDTLPLMLLALHMLALGVVAVLFLGMAVLHRRARASHLTEAGDNLISPGTQFMRPAIWLAIRSSNLKAVQTALGVGCSTPCSWEEGITGKHEFFIASPVNNWIIVTGSSLPRPGHDVDRCFYFLTRLSRILGRVQFFLADADSHYHAWANLDNGVVRRAYAWAGRTVWNQGTKTSAEIELNMKCFGYAESMEIDGTMTRPMSTANVGKVFLLAARWSINPIVIDTLSSNPASGIVGTTSLFCQD